MQRRGASSAYFLFAGAFIVHNSFKGEILSQRVALKTTVCKDLLPALSHE